MRSPLEDTIWGAVYGSCAAIQATFDRIGPSYHEAIMLSGVPHRAAACLIPHLSSEARGIDLGCGSGAMGLALQQAGFRGPLDGVDLSSGMLHLAQGTGCYRHLRQANLLEPGRWPKDRYDFVVTLGLIGDYVPYYLALPALVPLLAQDGLAGIGVEPKSTPERPLRHLLDELALEVISEDVLSIPAGGLESETYHFFVARPLRPQRADQTPVFSGTATSTLR